MVIILREKQIEEKLKYLGLDLNNIPDFLQKKIDLEYNFNKQYGEKNYKVYRYVNVNDITILLTQTNRLVELKEKIEKAQPIIKFITEESQDDIERFTIFLKMLKNIQIEDIEQIEEQQKQFELKTPWIVNYEKDYLWQIYYSKDKNQYFMLAPINDSDYAAIFYLLKEQLKQENKKIYVPICYAEYSEKFLNNSEISELENYLWLFTKDWPLVYEVYDENNKMTLQIIGKMSIYENIESKYAIKFENKEEAQEFFKTLKAMFLWKTEAPKEFDFRCIIDKNGTIKFVNKSEIITYEKLPELIKEKYSIIQEKTEKNKKSVNKEQLRIKRLKNILFELDKEYLDKEKEIATYLECKKTFLGRVKYYFKSKKKNGQAQENKKQDFEKTDRTIKNEETFIPKDFYTLEELIEKAKELQTIENKLLKLEMDIAAANTRIEIVEQKINNASSYIKEIDEHKKSIFEFWKYAKKDEVAQLEQAKILDSEKVKLRKTFDLANDLEDLAENADKLQRKCLNKEEINSTYIAQTNLLEYIKLAKKEDLTKEDLQKLENGLFNLLEELKEEKEKGKFDIFTGDLGNNYKILGNKKHRETEKNKFTILGVDSKTNLEHYIETLKICNINIESAFNNVDLKLEIPIYKVVDNNTLEKDYDIFYINPQEAIDSAPKGQNEIVLYRINLNKDIKAIMLTNIFYYNNMNNTLPMGMNISSKILVDCKQIKPKLKSMVYNNIINYNEETGTHDTTTIYVQEYDIE